MSELFSYPSNSGVERDHKHIAAPAEFLTPDVAYCIIQHIRESWEGIQLRLGSFQEATVEYIYVHTCFDWLI